MEQNEVLFEVETLQNWQLEANQVQQEEIAPGGASNSNSTNNSADEP